MVEEARSFAAALAVDWRGQTESLEVVADRGTLHHKEVVEVEVSNHVEGNQEVRVEAAWME